MIDSARGSMIEPLTLLLACIYGAGRQEAAASNDGRGGGTDPSSIFPLDWLHAMFVCLRASIVLIVDGSAAPTAYCSRVGGCVISHMVHAHTYTHTHTSDGRWGSTGLVDFKATGLVETIVGAASSSCMAGCPLYGRVLEW
eukprot:GHVU01006926.1.p3 GENE.GHVU01006926.1~~GHVU01006926.1.p3  ORF type:complete len:141 (-),score=8.23 GHVU01006926.1:809-1231(-)